jgi:hypothetical protein
MLSSAHVRVQRRLVIVLIVLAAVLPYLPTLDDYFMQDDFGVVGLLSSKPAGYFPRWFVTPWMEDIWGYVPDELRPFPALSYQLAALFGPASPVPNRAINIALHAVNAVLVFWIAEAAAALPVAPAAFAAIVFAVLPMQTESVAWITGRVDSMPACFYLASFLLYVHWRGSGAPSFAANNATEGKPVVPNAPTAPVYVWSVITYFIALFSKQNTVTLPVALMLYDVIIERRPMRPSWGWLRPYLPFIALTIGFLALRYAIFGEVAREGRLNADNFQIFLQDLSVHLRRMIAGNPSLDFSAMRAVVRSALGLALAAVVVLFARAPDRARVLRSAAFFLIVWLVLGIAPTIVAGYASPRHMYLAAAGWAVSLGIVLAMFWHARPQPLMKAAGVAFAALVVAAYTVQLRADVRTWSVRARVSHQVLADIAGEAAAAPKGTLIVIDAPERSWNFALPHALRPPFTRDDLTAHVAVVSHSMIYCCPAHVWEPDTRKVLLHWKDNAARPPAIAMRWDPETGQLFRLREHEDPFLRTAVSLLLDAPDFGTLDSGILNLTRTLATTPVR